MTFFSKKNNNVVKYKESGEIAEYLKILKKLTTDLNEKDTQICSIQEDYKKIFNLFSDSVVLISDDGTVIDLNRKAQIEFSNMLDNTIIGEKWKNVITKFDCSWENSLEKEIIEDKKYKEKSKEIYIDKLKKHFLISILPVEKNNNIQYFLFIARDVTIIKKRELDLIKKQKLISAVDRLTDIFGDRLNINYIMDRTVKILGQLEDIDRCYIFKNCKDTSDNMYAEKIKEYNKVKNYRFLNKFYYKDYFPRWKDYFDLNHIVCGSIVEFPQNEKYYLEKNGIKSICIVPIFIPSGLWGFIGFDCCLYEKIWTFDEERILKIAAHIIGGGIYQWSLRNNKDEVINKSCVNF